ncbi:MAG TPA: ferrochelatase [bacterium]|nr:ferrochelatase [bacterium]
MIGILLVNLGTPDAPTTSAVRRYLRQFLSDPMVIDINPVARALLVNFVIAPFRSPKSAAAYRKVWMPEGSPLLVHTRNLAKKVQDGLGERFKVAVGMRYGKPSIEAAVSELLKANVSEVRMLPLFPQYAASSTGSAVAEFERVMKKQDGAPPFRILPPFYKDAGFIEAFAKVAEEIFEKTRPDHVLFSFHGLPERHILKEDPVGNHCLKFDECCDQDVMQNQKCYRSHAFKTAHALRKRLGIPDDVCSVSFQSRLGRTPWLKPYTDLVIPELVKEGKKRIVVFCPAFVADCLETLEEIGIRARESATAAGAEAFEFVPSLNDSPLWVDAVCRMARS